MKLAQASLAVALLLLSASAAAANPVKLSSNLNLRAGSGTNHRVVVVLPAGTSVTVGDCDGEWCRVEARGQRGYASSAVVSPATRAFAAAPVTPSAPVDSRPDDGARVLQWHDREWRDRYWQDMETRRRQR